MSLFQSRHPEVLVFNSSLRNKWGIGPNDGDARVEFNSPRCYWVYRLSCLSYSVLAVLVFTDATSLSFHRFSVISIAILIFVNYQKGVTPV